MTVQPAPRPATDPSPPAAPDFGSLVREDRVHTSLYTDPRIFTTEMDKIFANTWVWVAHASELPEPGSFKTTYVGRELCDVGSSRRSLVLTVPMTRRFPVALPPAVALGDGVGAGAFCAPAESGKKTAPIAIDATRTAANLKLSFTFYARCVQ